MTYSGLDHWIGSILAVEKGIQVDCSKLELGNHQSVEFENDNTKANRQARECQRAANSTR